MQLYYNGFIPFCVYTTFFYTTNFALCQLGHQKYFGTKR
ncbi:protein of unknown function [Streptococcus thermophilus]|nr:protein of unknown function [Streptococcus thermophilus]CAD0149596.1 protein of unknown function [Streptococcus thermophilus]